jgi:hypothetical protein
MSNDSAPILLKIYEELTAIREILAKDPAAAAPTRSPAYSSGSSGAQAEIPQPSKIIDNPGDVQVHFGKNNGVALSALSERSLSWYASVKEPKLKNDGTPFTPRPQEGILENAARQLYHTRMGTLAGSENPSQRPAATPKQTPTESAGAASTEEVPFSPRHLDHG